MKGVTALFLAFAVVSVAAQQCPVDIPDDEKRDCYPWPDATQELCEERGCVYCELDDGSNAPWCFFNDKVCPSEIEDESRVDCMPEGGGPLDCTAKGCVWCESGTPGVPWCFDDPLVNQGGDTCPSDIPEGERVDCHPEPDASMERCTARGCYWCQTETENAPFCFMPREHGYRLVGTPVETPNGIEATLEKVNYRTWYGADIATVHVDIEFHTNDRLRIKFSDPSTERFEVPLTITNPPAPPTDALYDVEIVSLPVFGIRVIRKSSGAVIFDTTIGGLILSDQFLQYATRLESSNVYGFGEHEHHSLRHDMNWRTWAMWTRDHAVWTDTNLYGHQPFYMNVESDGSAHSVLILNANAADVTLMPGPAMLYRTIGGVLDLYFFMGPSPETSIQQYLTATGPPLMVPYWSLGFQLCRWGYADLEDLQDAVARMRQYDIPHDVQYGDIDYMEGRKDFTLDMENWADLPEYVQQLKEEGTRFVIILDPAIYNQDRSGGYPSFDRGHAQNVWVMGADGETPEEGEVWPGLVYFPDYTKPVTEEWWTEECILFKDVIDYAGLWIDMNEPANFIHGRAGGCANNKWNNPIFVPRITDFLENKTLCADTIQEMGRHYDVHSLYGWSMAKQSLPAARAVENNLKRSVVFARSTFPGAGQWGQHWLGDNWSLWSNLRWSIIGSLEFNMFGFPYTGADICGFIDPTTEELCQRWQQLGAFYTFSRNHNAEGNPPQDPGLWPEVARVTRETLLIRYTLLPYLYTLMNDAFMQGSTVMRPLFFEYPTDTTTLDIHDQFLWGSAFMISPVLDQGETSVNAYFPSDRWFSYYDGEEVDVKGGFTVLDAPLDFIPLHVRGGYIIPTQQPANSTMWSRSNPMGVIVALDELSQARGDLFWDDGEALDTQLTGDFFAVEYIADRGHLENDVTQDMYPPARELVLDDIRVLGDGRTLTTVTINGDPHESWTQTATGELTISDANIPLTSSFTVDWS